jgi:hypothetical protein
LYRKPNHPNNSSSSNHHNSNQNVHNRTPRIGAPQLQFFSTHKFMPAGMVATIGAARFAYNVKNTLEWWPDSE